MSLQVIGSVLVIAFLAVMWVCFLWLVVYRAFRDLRPPRRHPMVLPSPLAREIDRWRAAHERAYERESITSLGHVRVGIDSIKRRRSE